MLCFLAPLPAGPRDDLPPAPAPRDSGMAAAVLVALAALCAIIAPVGWAARAPHATAGVATATRFTPQAATVLPPGLPAHFP